MNRTILILFVLLQSFAFSQEKMSYYFDTAIVTNYTSYEIGFKGKVIFFKNHKDSTYTFSIFQNENIKEAKLFDFKNKKYVHFEANFDYKNIEDLSKLSNSILYIGIRRSNKEIKHKDLVEVMEYEKDTINNKTIVHLTQFKNKKKKKIINEHYYYFGKNNLVDIYKQSIKYYLVSKYNLQFIEKENLEKVIHLSNGKISNVTETLKVEYVDFNFTFVVDNVNPSPYKINIVPASTYYNKKQ